MQEKEQGERSIASGRKSDGGRETRGSHRKEQAERAREGTVADKESTGRRERER
jgi:hypothetical protein